ncbi:MAG TPA: hypothetical protein VFE09_07765 [Rubrobacteraceae bacterium]|nr:hypothetical protein [Rubrobacteraceae bacterium]
MCLASSSATTDEIEGRRLLLINFAGRLTISDLRLPASRPLTPHGIPPSVLRRTKAMPIQNAERFTATREGSQRPIENRRGVTAGGPLKQVSIEHDEGRNFPLRDLIIAGLKGYLRRKKLQPPGPTPAARTSRRIPKMI